MVLAGLGSMSGTLVAGLILGIAESIVLTMFGAAWAPAVAFGMLLSCSACARTACSDDRRHEAIPSSARLVAARGCSRR